MHTSVLVADEGDIYDLLDRFADDDGESASNDARWDNFGVGGVFAGMLPLTSRSRWRNWFTFAPRWLFGASKARKSDIDHASFLLDPPSALFFRGVLHECPMSEDSTLIAKWKNSFREMYDEIPEDAILQIVDAHS